MREIVIYRTNPERIISLAVRDSIFNQEPHWRRLEEYMRRNRLVKTGSEIVIFHYDPKEVIDPEWVNYEMAIPVFGEPQEPDPEILLKELPSILVASIIHRGHFDDIEKSYNKLLAWIKKKGYKTSGPAIEIRLRGRSAIDDERGLITEIQFPIS